MYRMTSVRMMGVGMLRSDYRTQAQHLTVLIKVNIYDCANDAMQ